MTLFTDATIREILIGIVGNGLWSLVPQSARGITEGVRKFLWSPQPSDVVAIRTAIDRLRDSGILSTGIQQERLWAYLRSPEIESIVRQLFASSLTDPRGTSIVRLVRREFCSSLSKHLDVDESRLQSAADQILDTIIANVGDALQTAINKNILSAHEVKSEARHRILLDEISNLQKNVEFLGSSRPLNIVAILDFERRYRELMGSVHGYVKPPHLESGRRVPIDEIFVAPQISRLPRKKAAEPETLSLSVFLSTMYRSVLLGNPGGGKSTTSAKICSDLATQYASRLFSRREITPVLITLREYGSQKKLVNCSIVQFMEQQAASRYQLAAPTDAFQYLLLNGRLLVIFDGLDELLDTGYRQEITQNVETFCSLYPSVPVLVTSREVGYDQAPLNEKIFELARLAPFDEGQVRDYAQKMVRSR